MTVSLSDLTTSPSAANSKSCDPHFSSDVSRDDTDVDRDVSRKVSLVAGHVHDVVCN